jgi:Flp pilus assembly pilin Flp
MNTLLSAYLNLMNSFQDEEGQDLVEYVLIMGLTAIAAVVGITAAGGSIQQAWTSVSGTVSGALP